AEGTTVCSPRDPRAAPASNGKCSSYLSIALTPHGLDSFPTRRSSDLSCWRAPPRCASASSHPASPSTAWESVPGDAGCDDALARSEEHTSELQSRGHLVCRLLLEKKNVKVGQGMQTSLPIIVADLMDV